MFRTEPPDWKRTRELSECIRVAKGTEYYVETLCISHRHATSPSILRTDEEHKVMRCWAKWIMSKLNEIPGWYEDEEGRIWDVKGGLSKLTTSGGN